MSVIRQTSDRCRVVKKILQNHMIRYEEKDLFMNKEHQKELVERLNTNRVILPQVFIDGIHLGVSIKLCNSLPTVRADQFSQ